MDRIQTIEELEELSPQELGFILLMAIKNKKELEYINHLISLGADLGAMDNNKSTIIHWAAKNGHVDIFIKAGLNPNVLDKKNHTPTHFAAAFNNPKEAKILIEAGADLDAKDKNGYTPLHWAARQGHIEIIRMLIAAGAPLDVKDFVGDTPWRLYLANNRNVINQIPELNPNYKD